jgi:hypothetical protein
MSKWRRLQKPIVSLKGHVSESRLCIDCGFDTAPGNLNRAQAEKEAARQVKAGIRNWKIPFVASSRSEMYWVYDSVWRAAGMTPGVWNGVLCVACLERRIGRELIPDDFPDDQFNTELPGTPRLLQRQGRLAKVEDHIGYYCAEDFEPPDEPPTFELDIPPPSELERALDLIVRPVTP